MKGITTLLAIILGYSPVLLFMFLFKWLRRSAKKLQPREAGSSIEFDLSPRMRILIRVVLLSLVLFSVLVFWTSLSQGGEGWYAVFIPLTVLLAILLTTPRTVVVDGARIRQRRLIRTDREIAWNEIARMRRGVNSGTTYVKSKTGGRPIPFSPLLIGQSRFEREVRSHAQECNDFSDRLDED